MIAFIIYGACYIFAIFSIWLLVEFNNFYLNLPAGFLISIGSFNLAKDICNYLGL